MTRRAGLLARLVVAASVLLVAACGGGGGGSSSASSADTSSGPPDNILAVTIESGPFDSINTPYASVTVCAPGGADCQTVDHVLVDTGSTGIRIFASALNSNLLQDFSGQTAGKAVTAICAQFADGYAWGALRQADIRLGGKSLSNVAIHVAGDTSFAAAPGACTSTGSSINTATAFGANGVIGVNVFLQDCGPACAQSASAGVYYRCSGGSCQGIVMPLSQQLQNPVSLFAADNNGVMFSLPPISSAGAVTASGSLIFGIGTRSNNAIGSSVAVLPTDPVTGYITTIYKSGTLSRSFIDSGSNGIYFNDTSIATCSHGFYCPSSTLPLSALNRGADGTTSTVNFNVANVNSLVVGNLTAFNNLAGNTTMTSSFDWGLPFFFGRSVYTAIETRSTPRGIGPYYAY
jgi:hypothetical protein